MMTEQEEWGIMTKSKAGEIHTATNQFLAYYYNSDAPTRDKYRQVSKILETLKSELIKEDLR